MVVFIAMLRTVELQARGKRTREKPDRAPKLLF